MTSRDWARTQFEKFRGAVAFIETQDKKGDVAIGTCFHIGEGIFLTARHVVEGRHITKIGFDDTESCLQLLRDPKDWCQQQHGLLSITRGPFFHANEHVDIACFQAVPFPNNYILLGGHLDDFIGQYEFVLHRVLIMGYPKIPLSTSAVLVASIGEINAIIDKTIGKHPHFIISTVARGGFSGGPALVAYSETNESGGTAALGLITESLGENYCAAELGYMAVISVEPLYDCLVEHDLLPPCQSLQ